MARKFSYFRVEVDDIDVIRELLTKEQAIELIYAISDYAKDGTITNVCPEGKGIYLLLRKKIDRAQQSYEKKCATLAENGAKGGRAKAENSKAGARPKFKPPTKKEFMAAVEALTDDEYFSVTTYSTDKFFSDLKESGWKINGEPIQVRDDWEKAIVAHFYKPESTISHLYYWAFAYAFSTYNGLRDANGKTMAEDLASEFISMFDEDRKCWKINGKTYPFTDRQDALDTFVTNRISTNSESKPP